MNPIPTHILVVDDDERLCALVSRYLTEQGFVAITAANAAEAAAQIQTIVFDLIVLDIMMPGESGLSLVKRLHKSPDFNTPILLLTAMSEPEDRIAGLETGADDYLTKPFEPRELILRIQAILRRRGSDAYTRHDKKVAFGEFTYHPDNAALRYRGENIHLTSQEQSLLSLLARQAGKPVSREALAKAAGFAGSERTVDVQINRLRKKIEPNTAKPCYIQTSRGLGYVLRVDS